MVEKGGVEGYNGKGGREGGAEDIGERGRWNLCYKISSSFHLTFRYFFPLNLINNILSIEILVNPFLCCSKTAFVLYKPYYKRHPPPKYSTPLASLTHRFSAVTIQRIFAKIRRLNLTKYFNLPPPLLSTHHPF